MTIEGMGPSLAVEGATTARVFETYVEKMLVPNLRAGQIVVMDNLGAHRPKRIGQLIERRGCELLYLPAYSPDYNPIEEAFATLKHLLREAAARSKGALVEAIGAALSAVTAQDARGFFEHAGYQPAGQLLSDVLSGVKFQRISFGESVMSVVSFLRARRRSYNSDVATSVRKLESAYQKKCALSVTERCHR